MHEAGSWGQWCCAASPLIVPIPHPEMLILRFAEEFFHLVSPIQITPPMCSLHSAAQSDHLPPPGPIKRASCIAPTAGSCPDPSMTLTALLQHREHDITLSVFIPCLPWSTPGMFPALLTWPSLSAKPGYLGCVSRGEWDTMFRVNTSFLTLVWKHK